MDPKALWAALPRPAKIYLAAVGVAGVAGVAGIVTVAAASPSPGPSASPRPGQAYCSTFTGHLASNLGKSQSQVQKAISDAIGQTLGDAVENGDLTQKQADAIKARIGGQACPAAVPGLGGPGRFGDRVLGPGPGFGFGGPRRAVMGGLDDYARALGISQSELQQDLQAGKTIQEIAASKGMDESAFRSKLVAIMRSDLDAQVNAGNLTQKQEDAILQRLQNDPLPLWNRTFPPRPPRPEAPGGQAPGVSPPA